MLDFDIHKKRGDFSLDLRHHCTTHCTGIFGPSGSGKSTLLHIIAGLLVPDSGSIQLHNVTLFEYNVHIPPQERSIGYVRQDPLLFPHMSVQENLQFAQKHTRSTPKWTLSEDIHMFALQAICTRKPQTLSGGEKQKVALARALLASPQLLLLDEPMASLDEPATQEILTQLHALKSHLPMLYVSHSKERIHFLCDEILYLNNGVLHP